MSDLTLYAITDTLPALLDSLDMCETDEQRAECEAEIQRYFAALPAKVDGVARFREHLAATVALSKAEAKRVSARADRFQRMLDRIDWYTIRILERLPEPKYGTRRLEGETATLALRRCPPSLHVFDATRIPAEYMTVIPARSEVCNSAVKDALKAGVEVPGAELITDKKRLEVS